MVRDMEIEGVKLQRLREERVLSQRELARMAGLTHQTVWRFENGWTNAHPQTIRKIAKALGVEPKELVKGKE
jgi:transcriptional regulator with XRE-family HTH domain